MSWSGGLAEWIEGDTAMLSVAFTWRLQDAYQRAAWYRAQGYRVRAGGPAVFRLADYLAPVAVVGGDAPDAISHHNPLATIASRGCPVGCWFCIVPKMEGREFTLLPDFPVRPVLCDNNLSALPPDYQEHIIRRYQDAGVNMIDANSGFEPVTFSEEVYRRWMPLVNAGGGPWRFAYDETKEGPEVRRVMRMLRDEPQKRKRVYVLIGNEPFAECMARINEVIAGGCEPHVQPYIKLTASERRPKIFARLDWTEQKLKDVARWANSWLWKRIAFTEYAGSIHARARDKQTVEMWA